MSKKVHLSRFDNYSLKLTLILFKLKEWNRLNSYLLQCYKIKKIMVPIDNYLFKLTLMLLKLEEWNHLNNYLFESIIDIVKIERMKSLK